MLLQKIDSNNCVAASTSASSILIKRKRLTDVTIQKCILKITVENNTIQFRHDSFGNILLLTKKG